MAKKALIVGATGMVGQQLLNQMLQHKEFTEIITLTRKTIAITHPKLTQKVFQFDQIRSQSEMFNGVDAVFCSLGTTMQNAGSKEAFYKVDYEYVSEIAKIAREKGVKQFIYVSSLGANVDSNIYYSKVKGEVEAMLKKLNFNQLIIIRPSLLLGNRSETRIGEKIGIGLIKVLKPLLIGGLRKYRGINVKTVAAAMIRASITNGNRYLVVENDMVEEMGS